MRIALGIRTTDRSPGPNYLGGTLRSLQAAGVFESPHFGGLSIVGSSLADLPWINEQARCGIYCQVRCGKEIERTEHAARYEEFTPNETAAEALADASRGGADWVMHVEDDVEFCGEFLKSAAAWLTDHAEPDVPLYSFGLPPQIDPEAVGGSAHRWEIQGFYGTQCYAVRGEDAPGLVAWLRAHPVYRESPGSPPKDSCHDLLLHAWARELHPQARFFLATCPSFVRHVGERSTLGKSRFFTHPSWPGPAWTYTSKGGAQS